MKVNFPATSLRIQQTSSHHEYLSDAAIHDVISPAKEFTLWVSHQTTGLPSLYEDKTLSIPEAIQILATAHLISHPRGLLYVPARTTNESVSWVDHPFFQTLQNRLSIQWRASRDTHIDLTPFPQPRKATRDQIQTATKWFLEPHETSLALSIYATIPLQ